MNFDNPKYALAKPVTGQLDALCGSIVHNHVSQEASEGTLFVRGTDA